MSDTSLVNILINMGLKVPYLTEREAMRICNDMGIDTENQTSKKSKRSLTHVSIPFEFIDPNIKDTRYHVQLNAKDVNRALKYMSNKKISGMSRKLPIMFEYTSIGKPKVISIKSEKWTQKVLLKKLFDKYMRLGLTENVQITGIHYDMSHKCLRPELQIY